MTQESTNVTFHRQTNQVELARPVEANSVEFLNILPPGLATNAKRIWVEQLTETLNFTVDGVDIHTIADRLDLGYVNAKWFGIDGNGVTDDTVAVKNLLNSNFPLIFFPAGTYKLTNTMLINAGVAKKIVGTPNTVFSVTLPSSINLFDFKINVEVEQINFNFNNGFVLRAMSYDENIGTISVKDVQIYNVRDTDFLTSTTLIDIATSGNKCDIDGVTFMNCLKRGNGNITDSAGNITGVFVSDRVTVAPTSGSIKNVTVIEMHNIDAVGTIIFEDTSGIYPISGYNLDTNLFLSIENVYGYNFGKRLIKTHTSNLNISNVYGYSNTNDALSVIGLNTGQTLGEKKNINISDVQAYGIMNAALAFSGNHIQCNNVAVDILPPAMSGNIPNSFGFSISGDQVTITNAIVKAERPVLFNRTNDFVRDFKIASSVLTVSSTGLSGFHIASSSTFGFKKMMIDNVTVNNIAAPGGINGFIDTSTLTGVANRTGEGLMITNCTFTSTALNHTPVYARFIDGIDIVNFITDNDGVNQVFRGMDIASCTRIRIQNFYLRGLVNNTAVLLASCTDARIFGVDSATGTFSVVVNTSTNVRLKDVNKTKVLLNDATSLAGSAIEAESSIGTTANRPTGTVLSPGFQYFDTTLGKPIWRNAANTQWVDATGVVV